MGIDTRLQTQFALSSAPILRTVDSFWDYWALLALTVSGQQVGVPTEV